MAAGQTETTQLDTLAVELWPDYDRPAMLVLLTGTLPEGATLPATLTIPIPPNADINAVARFNEADGLISDVDYTALDNRLTMTTPTNRFRVEYYAPYEVDGNEHTYAFDWTSDLSIDEVTTIVQQPTAATDFRTTPASTGSAADRGDSLAYHTLPAKAVGAGQPYTVEVVYTVEAPVLSAPSQTLPGESAATVPDSAGASTATTSAIGGISPWWLLAAVGVLALVGGAWYLGRRQGNTTSRARKPQPVRATKPTGSKPPAGTAASAKFCHSCGRPAEAKDIFCRNCGTRLKGD